MTTYDNIVHLCNGFDHLLTCRIYLRTVQSQVENMAILLHVSPSPLFSTCLLCLLPDNSNSSHMEVYKISSPDGLWSKVALSGDSWQENVFIVGSCNALNVVSCVYIITINFTRHLFHSRAWVMDIVRCFSVTVYISRAIESFLQSCEVINCVMKRLEISSWALVPEEFAKVSFWMPFYRGTLLSGGKVRLTFNFSSQKFSIWETTFYKTCLSFSEQHDICKKN